ncbi:extracellular solute-binding protein [Pseudoclavibacter sp. CFCC 13611]|uniref:extracellular solute-binding protein n=1 Tax=Pseudoclavibacter sp. CFCC 13611 TaxID=2615178 RepID=UPI001CE45F45|nr:extracellular solute-binding protein [Pseudoclavibacter sp. CFCC 13611]
MRKYQGIAAVGMTAALLVGLAGCSGSSSSSADGEQDGDSVITYNSPKEWGNYGEVLSSFTQETGIQAPNDPKNSGQALAAMQSERDAPVADVAYVGIAFAQQLTDAGLLQPYAPKGTENETADLKSSDDLWHTVHTGTVAFIVNKDALGDLPTPTSWADLLKSEYHGKVGYLDPSQAAVGYSVATAANLAMGGDLDNWQPGLDYLGKLKDNGAVTPAQTATAKVSQGEIPILIDTDFNGYNLKDKGSNVDVVIPQEGSLQMPYVVGLVKDAPHPNNGKRLLDFYFSEQGQSLFAKGYMRPALGSMPDDVKSKVLPDADYERAKTVDFIKMGSEQKSFIDLYTAQVANR